jgi:hypothetical protein
MKKARCVALAKLLGNIIEIKSTESTVSLLADVFFSNILVFGGSENKYGRVESNTSSPNQVNHIHE